jgi:ATP-binding cassette subfamily F protein 3
LATKIWDIRDESILEYQGSLYEYYDHLSGLDNEPGPIPQEAGQEKGESGDKGPKKSKESRKALRKEKAQKRTLIQSKLKPIQDRLSQLEDRIAALEKREKEISEILSDPDTFKDNAKSGPLLKEYRQTKDELEACLFKWEENQKRLEGIQEGLQHKDGDT